MTIWLHRVAVFALFAFAGAVMFASLWTLALFVATFAAGALCVVGLAYMVRAVVGDVTVRRTVPPQPPKREGGRKPSNE